MRLRLRGMLQPASKSYKFVGKPTDPGRRLGLYQVGKGGGLAAAEVGTLT